LATLTGIVSGLGLVISLVADAGANPTNAAVDGRGRSGSQLTDLQLFRVAVQAVVGELLDGLPGQAESGVVLLPDAQQAKDWIAEDALARAALKLGIPVILKRPESDERAWTLYYRVIDPQVVYEPQQAKWLFFGRGMRRIARGTVFLRLESEHGAISWARDREIRMEAGPFGEGSADLARSALVDQTRIQVDNRSAELGLSTALIGGLFYIFFIL
jgi:hypothetical protein